MPPRFCSVLPNALIEPCGVREMPWHSASSPPVTQRSIWSCASSAAIAASSSRL
jgi:hypothetical protein